VPAPKGSDLAPAEPEPPLARLANQID
jgi:hypothetical protein